MSRSPYMGRRETLVTIEYACLPSAFSRFRGVLIQKLAKDKLRVSFECFRDCDELDHVEPTLTAFVFCDERLRCAEPVGHGLLRETDPRALLPQEGDEDFVFVGPKCLAHAPEPEGCKTSGDFRIIPF